MIVSNAFEPSAEGPPAARLGRRDWPDLLLPLVESPNTWHVITVSTTGTAAYLRRRAASGAFFRGVWEFTERSREDGMYDLWARYREGP